jgi:hydroxyacylglutathione hydrolase
LGAADALQRSVHAIPDAALGNTSYLLAVDAGSAVVVDPRRDIEEYLRLAERLHVRIVGALETHVHADFVSGAAELAAATGARIYAAADAGLTAPHTPVASGELLSIGGATIEVRATPGHTPEHVAYLVTLEGAPAVFSGGSLIVGGAARTDLTGPERTEELAKAQVASLRTLAALPDETVLYPTHGAGSFCSMGPAQSTSSTIEAERASNPLLADIDDDQLVDRLLSGFGSYPRYFLELRRINRVGAPLLGSLPPVPRTDSPRIHKAVARGAWLIDGRPVADWAAGHPTGAISIEVRPSFASWLGWVVPFGAPVALVLDPEHVREALILARRIGYDRIEGWTTFEEWRDAGLPVSAVEAISPEQAARRWETGTVLLDVRQRAEFDVSRLPGATHLELGDIIAGKIPEAAEVVSYCGGGQRSATAASLLARRGVRVANLTGGTRAWGRAGLPLET